jgi:predicted PurR-regulated permease PerM
MPEKIEISYRTILFTVFLLIALWFLYQIRQIIFLLFISLIFTAALGPLVTKMEKLKIPRAIAILLLYIVLVGGLAGSIASVVPMVVVQTSELSKDLPEFLNKIGFFKLDLKASDYSSELLKLPANVFKIISATFSNILTLMFFLVVNFYLLMERKNLTKHFQHFFAESGAKKAERLTYALEFKLGGWVRGELILMVLVGLMSYVGLTLLDIEFVLPLALVAGFLELIPNIGPTVSAVPAIIVGLASSPVIGLAVLALYILIQQLENNFIVPKVMQKVVGLHPLVTLIALMIGFKIGGVIGSLLAVPAVLFIRVLIDTFYPSKRKTFPQK